MSHTTSPVPSIISMDVDHEQEVDSEYRVRIGNDVKYLVMAPETFDSDTLSMPLSSLSMIPFEESWVRARIGRDAVSGELQITYSDQKLKGVDNVWHGVQIDVLALERVTQLTGSTFEATCRSGIPGVTSPSSSVIAKIARFEWEVPRIERETRAYQILHDHTDAAGLAPRFLGHLREGDRVMGFVLEKLSGGRRACIDDIHDCEAALRRFYGLGLLHGDVNRHNFILTERGVTLIDFEGFREDASEEAQAEELGTLDTQLREATGRGGGYMAVENETAS